MAVVFRAFLIALDGDGRAVGIKPDHAGIFLAQEDLKQACIHLMQQRIRYLAFHTGKRRRGSELTDARHLKKNRILPVVVIVKIFLADEQSDKALEEHGLGIMFGLALRPGEMLPDLFDDEVPHVRAAEVVHESDEPCMLGHDGLSGADINAFSV